MVHSIEIVPDGWISTCKKLTHIELNNIYLSEQVTYGSKCGLNWIYIGSQFQ